MIHALKAVDTLIKTKNFNRQKYLRYESSRVNRIEYNIRQISGNVGMRAMCESTCDASRALARARGGGDGLLSAGKRLTLATLRYNQPPPTKIMIFRQVKCFL